MSIIRRFLGFVEIMTKITSVLPFFLVLAYLYLLRKPIDPLLTLLFFASMFLFDLTTTAINNYIDTKTNGVPLQFPRKTAFALILVLFFISSGLGILLAVLTDCVVLILGGLCFLCGVLYTAGPIPISRLPLGEIFSGLFYGVFLTLILFYINLPPGELLRVQIVQGRFNFSLSLPIAFSFALLCAAPVCATSNIMLANNICDVQKDVAVGRHTLPYYLNRNALHLFALLYALPYVAAVVQVLAGYLPLLYLGSLITAPVIFRNVRRFYKTQEKSTTFLLSVQNFVLMLCGNILFLVICALSAGNA